MKILTKNKIKFEETSMIKWCIIGAGGIADRRTIPAILSDNDNKIRSFLDKSKE